MLLVKWLNVYRQTFITWSQVHIITKLLALTLTNKHLVRLYSWFIISLGFS